MREKRSSLQHVLFAALVYASFAPYSQAAVFEANSTNYQTLAAGLKAGDTLRLAPGEYDHGLLLINKVGTATQPIVIVGPADHSARLAAPDCCSVVQIRAASFLQLRNLTLEVGSTGVDSSAGSDHVLLENLQIVGDGSGAHTVGIATHGRASDWTIRRDMISGVETGLQLGSPDGSAPFVSGLIEYNVVVDTSGANLQIARGAGSPITIRHNTFSKDLSGLMSERSGSADDIYGNVFYANERSARRPQNDGASARDNLLLDHAAIDSSNPYVEASGGGTDPVQWRIAAVQIAAATPTVTMTASPTNVAAGGTTLISWTSTGAVACAASGGWTGTKGANGSETVGPIQSATSYQLTCLGEGGNAGAMVLVTVGGSAPNPTPAPDPTPTPTPSPNPTPTPTPDPTPTPSPTPTPDPTPSPTPAPPTGSQMSGGGGGAVDPLAITVLLLLSGLDCIRRKRPSQVSQSRKGRRPWLPRAGLN